MDLRFRPSIIGCSVIPPSQQSTPCRYEGKRNSKHMMSLTTSACKHSFRSKQINSERNSIILERFSVKMFNIYVINYSEEVTK